MKNLNIAHSPFSSLSRKCIFLSYQFCLKDNLTPFPVVTVGTFGSELTDSNAGSFCSAGIATSWRLEHLLTSPPTTVIIVNNAATNSMMLCTCFHFISV